LHIPCGIYYAILTPSHQHQVHYFRVMIADSNTCEPAVFPGSCQVAEDLKCTHLVGICYKLVQFKSSTTCLPATPISPQPILRVERRHCWCTNKPLTPDSQANTKNVDSKRVRKFVPPVVESTPRTLGSLLRYNTVGS